MNRFKVWPVGLFCVLLLFAAVQLTMVAIAERNFEGPDDEQYYNDGLQYNRELEATDRQARLGWVAHPTVSNAHVTLTLSVAGADVDVDIGHPATRRDDRHLTLSETTPGRYDVACVIPPGVWDVTYRVRHGADQARYTVRRTLP